MHGQLFLILGVRVLIVDTIFSVPDNLTFALGKPSSTKSDVFLHIV